MKKSKSKCFNNKELKNFIILVVVIALLFGGMITYGKYKREKEETKNDYNRFQFYYDELNGYWLTQIQIGETPYNIPFYHHPSELEDIIVEENIEDIILRTWPKQIIVAIPKDSGAEMFVSAVEITKITGDRYNLFNIPTSSAVNEVQEGLPIATCADASRELVVINFIKSDKNLISSEGRCIKLEFKDNESTRVADALAYRLLKIV